MTGGEPGETALTSQDRALSWGLGGGVLLLYLLTFASVPTSDGLTFIGWVDGAIASGGGRLPVISNAPFSYYLVYLLKRAALALGAPVPTLRLLQGVSAVVTALGCVAFYRALRLVGAATFWALVGTGLLATSYGVWYFANGEVHHVGLGILLVLFYWLTRIRRSGEGPSPYPTLIGLGLLNAVAVFFHQEHFLFGLVAVALLAWGRPWRRAVREIAAYGLAGTLGTMLLILATGWFAAGDRTLRAIVAWYFWEIGYLVREYQPEPIWVIALRLVKGQLTAFVYGVQIIADAARDRGLLAVGLVRGFVGLTAAALVLAAILAAEPWRARRRLVGELRALAIGAVVWLVAYPILLSWYFPAVTEYYLKTVPPLVLLLLLGPIARERAGLASRRLRAVGAALLGLVVLVNVLTAILPWYRYGLMRDRLGDVAAALFRPGDLVVSTESGIDSVLAGRVEQLHVKDLLYREGKARGFETIRAEIASRLTEQHRVFVHNLVPSRWALQGLNEPTRNPRRDRYTPGDFEALLDELNARYRVVRVLAYWEESKEPLYLYGRRLEPLFEVRRRF